MALIIKSMNRYRSDDAEKSFWKNPLKRHSLQSTDFEAIRDLKQT
jgi:hypothetical protein